MQSQRKVRRILANGIPGRAQIQAMSSPPQDAGRYTIAMTLIVFVEGIAPYEVEDRWLVSSKMQLGWGLQLPVKVDPDDPQQVAVDWDAAFEEQQQREQQRREALQQMGPIGPGGIPQAGTKVIDARSNPELRERVLDMLRAQGIQVPDRTDAEPDDVIGKLERLTALREGGVLTESEFRTQKRKLLGED